MPPPAYESLVPELPISEGQYHDAAADAIDVSAKPLNYSFSSQAGATARCACASSTLQRSNRPLFRVATLRRRPFSSYAWLSRERSRLGSSIGCVDAVSVQSKRPGHR